MFKFFRKKTLTQSQETQERTAYVKSDLVLFSRRTNYETAWDYNAEKVINENMQYFFVGIYNKDKSKVKNVLTGEIFETNRYSFNEVKTNNFIYERINLTTNEITNGLYSSSYYFEFSKNPYLDISRLNSELIKTSYDESPIYTFIKKSPDDTCSLILIRNLVNAINNRIHINYEKGIIEYNEFQEKQKK